MALILVLTGPLIWAFYVARKYDNMVESYENIKMENTILKEKNKRLCIEKARLKNKLIGR